MLVVPTTAPEDIEQYSIRVVEGWKLGRAKPDDGVLLLLAKDDHTTRIEVGYGLEGALTDATSNRIIDETMIPLLKQGQYFAGLSAGVAQIMRVVDGEALPPPDVSWKGNGNALGHALPALFIGFFVVSSILRSLFGRVGGAAASAGLVGVVAWFFSQLLLAAVGFAVLGFVRVADPGPERRGLEFGRRAEDSAASGDWAAGALAAAWRWWIQRWRRRLRGRRRLGALVMRLRRIARHWLASLQARPQLLPAAALAQIEPEIERPSARTRAKSASRSRPHWRCRCCGTRSMRARAPCRCSLRSASGTPSTTTAC